MCRCCPSEPGPRAGTPEGDVLFCDSSSGNSRFSQPVEIQRGSQRLDLSFRVENKCLVAKNLPLATTIFPLSPAPFPLKGPEGDASGESSLVFDWLMRGGSPLPALHLHLLWAHLPALVSRPSPPPLLWLRSPAVARWEVRPMHIPHQAGAAPSAPWKVF